MDTKEKNRSRRKPAAKAPARDPRSRRSAPSGQKRQAQPAKRRAAQQKSRRTEQTRRAAVQTQQRKKRMVLIWKSFKRKISNCTAGVLGTERAC